MPLVPNFTPGDIEKHFSKFLKVVEESQVKLLQRLGEECVTHARLIPKSVGFRDQTGNLRASIGYVVFKDGRTVCSNYENKGGDSGGEDTGGGGGDHGGVLVGHSGGGSEGVITGIALAKKVALDFPNNLILVVTAGMNYAAAVESRGKDVLASAEILATREFPRLVDDLKRDIVKAMQ